MGVDIPAMTVLGLVSAGGMIELASKTVPGFARTFTECTFARERKDQYIASR